MVCIKVKTISDISIVTYTLPFHSRILSMVVAKKKIKMSDLHPMSWSRMKLFLRVMG